ncbi:hypothetical protein D3C80_1490800 [compost metagenome]
MDSGCALRGPFVVVARVPTPVQLANLHGQLAAAVDRETIAGIQLIVGNGIAHLVVDRRQERVELDVGVAQIRVGLFTRLVIGRLTVSDEECLVTTGATCSLEVRKPVGGCFEGILIVGAAIGVQRTQRTQQGLEARIVEGHRYAALDLACKVDQQNVHRPGL